MFFKLLPLLLLCSGHLVQSDTYDGYKIYHIYAKTRLEKAALLVFRREPEYDFFSLPRALDEPAHVMVHPDAQANFENTLSQLGISFSLINDDVGESVRQERMQILRKPLKYGRQSSIAFDNFYRHEEINAYLDQLAINHPSRVHVKTFGRSHEGRDMKGITITNGDGRSNKSVIFIDAGIHACEWIAPPTALYVVHQLVEHFEKNKALLKDYDWVILPVLNPDGYEYAHTGKRFWRKNRKPVTNSSCIGTDLNRNFDYQWGGLGTSDNACSSIFRGTRPASEPETRVVRDIMHTLRGQAKFYLTVHSYGPCLVYPWGYNNRDLPSNWQDIDRVAKAGAAAIEAATGSEYRVGSAGRVMSPGAGGSDDYALHIGIPISITMEMPAGRGGNGFEVEPELIKPYVREGWIGIKAMAEVVIKNF